MPGWHDSIKHDDMIKSVSAVIVEGMANVAPAIHTDNIGTPNMYLLFLQLCDERCHRSSLAMGANNAHYTTAFDNFNEQFYTTITIIL